MYRIADEPSPSKWKSMATSPFFPLLAAMLAGQWLAWPWFIMNSIAMGSPTRDKELRVIALALVGSIVGAAVVVAIPDENVLGWRLALLALTVWKLSCAYVIHNYQARTWQLFQHYEGDTGRSRNGLFLVLGGAFFLRPLLMKGIDSLFFKLIIAGGIG
jgi:hypothetical protein